MVSPLAGPQAKSSGRWLIIAGISVPLALLLISTFNSSPDNPVSTSHNPVPDLVPHAPPPPPPPKTSRVTATDFGYTQDEFLRTFNGMNTGIGTRRPDGCVPGREWNHDDFAQACAYKLIPDYLALELSLTAYPEEKVKTVFLTGILTAGNSRQVEQTLAGCTAIVTLLNPEVTDKAALVYSMARAISQNQSGAEEVRQIGNVRYTMRSSKIDQVLVFSCRPSWQPLSL